jgi:drug/metabolite transporter (DMT)-like permease
LLSGVYARETARFCKAERNPQELYNKQVTTTELIGGSPAAQDSRKEHARLKPKTFFMILVMVICGPLGNVLLGKGMKQVGTIPLWPVSHLLHDASRIFTTVPIWLGISSLLVFFIANMLVLSWADYSFVQPASSLAYLVVALLGYFLLGEHVSPLHWAGIFIICMGVFVVSRTTPRTTNPELADPS